MLTAYRSLQHGVAIVLVISLGKQLRDLNPFVFTYIAINWLLVILSLTGLHGDVAWIARPHDETVMFSAAGTEQWRFRSALGSPSYVSIVAAVGAVSLAVRSVGAMSVSRGLGVCWLALTTILTVSRTAIAGLCGGMFIVGRSLASA